ncbi:Major facilitator sugar transporter-like [Trinorchestia longiramus]|nr:Major facilitator sugar transporter-like [Trinorchestia longiramus]
METNAKDFDSILDSVNGYGRYQKKLMYFVVGFTSFIIGIQVSTKVFQTIVQDHWCYVENRESTSMTPEQWKNFTIPGSKDKNGFNQCEQYVISWSCRSWEYDRSTIHETLATSYDWVCSTEMYSIHMLSVSIAGNCVGTILLPFLADRYTGRRLMYIVSICFHFVFEVATIFTRNFYLQLAWRFLGGFGFQTNYQMSYIISVELMSPNKRAMAGTLSFATWTVGMCLTSFIAWVLSDWRYITAVSAILDFYMFAVYWMIPESPRWLLSKERTKEAVAILVEVAEVNKMPDISHEELHLQLQAIVEPEPENLSPTNIKRFPKFCRTVLLMFFISGANYVVYGLISLDVDFVPNSYYMNFFFLSLCEFPSHGTAWVGVEYLGRRLTAILTNALAVLVSVIAVFVLQQKTALLVVVCILKWLITAALLTLYLQVTELYPTTMRSIGMGTIAVFGTAFFTTAPYIIKADDGTGWKYWLLAGLCLWCTIFSIPLPETLFMPLPQTLIEADSVCAIRPLNKLVVPRPNALVRCDTLGTGPVSDLHSSGYFTYNEQTPCLVIMRHATARHSAPCNNTPLCAMQQHAALCSNTYTS